MIDKNYKPVVHCSTKDMTVTEWENERRNSIGGSDMATILGLSPYGNTKLDLYMQKTGVSPVVGLTNNQEVVFNSGHFLENAVSNLFSYRTGYQTHEIKSMFEHPRYPMIRANIDRFYNIRGKIDAVSFLECKSSSEFKKGDWGIADDEAPIQYKVQTSTYMSVMNVDECKIACLFLNEQLRWIAGILYQMRFVFEALPKSVLGDINDQLKSISDDSVQAFVPVVLSLLKGEMTIPEKYIANCSDAIGKNFIIRTIHRDEAFEEYMLGEAEKFWNNHIVKRVPPTLDGEDPEAAIETLEKYIPKRKVKAPIVLTGSGNVNFAEVAEEIAELKAQQSNLKAESKAIDSKLERLSIPFIEALNGANMGEFEADGEKHLVTYEGKPRISFPSANLGKLKTNYPDAYNEYVKESVTKPTLKIK